MNQTAYRGKFYLFYATRGRSRHISYEIGHRGVDAVVEGSGVRSRFRQLDEKWGAMKSHSARRAFASYVPMMNFKGEHLPIHVVQRLLGHKDVSMTMDKYFRAIPGFIFDPKELKWPDYLALRYRSNYIDGAIPFTTA